MSSLTVRAVGRATLAVIAELQRRGCAVLSARVLPQAAVRVDRAPAGLQSYGYIEPPPFTRHVPTEHVAHVRGVRITWFAHRSNLPANSRGGRHV